MSVFQQREAGWMVYPGHGWRRFFFKMPLFWWRMGLGPLLSPTFLVLTTTGRRSGLPRHTMLEHSVADGKTFVASGWGGRTDWYQNIQANPRVTIQTAAGIQPVVARQVTEIEAILQLYEHAQKNPAGDSYLDSLGIQPTREDFVAKKDRLLILIFDPTDEPTPPPLTADLAWLWPAIAGVVAIGWTVGRLSRSSSYES